MLTTMKTDMSFYTENARSLLIELYDEYAMGITLESVQTSKEI